MKALFISFLLLFMVSCSPFGFNPMGYEVLHEDLDTAWKRVSAMEYASEPGPGYNKSPAEFFRDGFGDCEDFAIALVYLLGPGSALVFIDRPETNGHSIVSYNGKYLEPQVYAKYFAKDEISIQYSCSYNYIMRLATDWGTRGL